MNQELTIKQEIDQRLVAAGVTEEVIAGLEKLADEHDNEITSQEQFKAVDRARKDIKEVRLVGVNNAEAIHERAKQLWQQSKSIVNDLTRRLKAPEGRLQARVDEWEFKIQQQKEAEAKAFQAEVQARNNSLMSLGYILMDGVWTLDGVSVDAEVVLKETHHQWNEIRFPQLRMHGEEVAAAKAEAVRLQEQEAERLRKEREELEAREAALKEATERMMLVLEESRKNELLALGCTEWEQDNGSGTRKYIGVRYTGPAGAVTIYPFALSELRTETQWDEVIKDVRHALGELKKHKDADVARQAELARRQAAKEEAIRQQERDRLAKEQADRELAEQLEAEQRIALYGDSEHIRHCMELLKHAGSKMTEILPSIKTQAIRDKVSANRDMLRQMYVELNKLQQ